MRLAARVKIDPEGRPCEVFLSGAKDGSGLAAILEDSRGDVQLCAPARLSGGGAGREPRASPREAMARPSLGKRRSARRSISCRAMNRAIPIFLRKGTGT